MANIITIKCKGCSKDFITRMGKAKFCSKRCYFAFPRSKEHSKHISDAHKSFGERHWAKRPEVRAKMGKHKIVRYWLGKKRSDISGENHYAWANNPRLENHRIRGTVEYIKWRKEVFERDNYTCQECGVRGGRLEADHIKPFSKFPELRFMTSNGRTLCVPCHRATPTWGAKLRTLSADYSY